MSIPTLAGSRFLTTLTTAVTLVGVAAFSQAQPPIIQPGAPGEPSREITAEEASDLAGIRYTDGDVKFLQEMISHHAQALEMTALLETRTERGRWCRIARTRRGSWSPISWPGRRSWPTISG